MGLRVSTESGIVAFEAAYSSFNRLRRAIAEHIGGKWVDDFVTGSAEITWYFDPDRWPKERWPGMVTFMSHSDCDGTIEWDDLMPVAFFLWEVAKGIGDGGEGHLASRGGHSRVCIDFANACAKAHKAGEPMEFC